MPTLDAVLAAEMVWLDAVLAASVLALAAVLTVNMYIEEIALVVQNAGKVVSGS